MKYNLSRDAVLKWLEIPCVYHIKNDELYELDQDAFNFLKDCSGSGLHSQDNEFLDYCLQEKLVTRKRVAVKRPLPVKSPDPSLRYLELQITNNCNLRCRHCYINFLSPPSNFPFCKGVRPQSVGQGHGEVKGAMGKLSEENRSELSIKQIRAILKEFEQMQGLRVLITGGEPLLHSKFEEINEMLPQFLLRKVLISNGILLDEKRIERLNVDEIQISIDGLENAHDSLRGKGTYRLAMKAAQCSLDHGFHVSIATMIHPKNLTDFDEMERLFKDMGIKEWAVDVPCITGRLEQNTEFQISPEIGGRYLKYGYGGGLHTANPGFACGLHLMTVMADGKAAKCTFYSDNAVGSVEEGLRTCWQRIEPIRLDELKCDCAFIESCRGGCRYRAALSGDLRGKDPYRCALYGVI
jgi:radical SAM protein with 4Fe4S-binding SPASM domain